MNAQTENVTTLGERRFDAGETETDPLYDMTELDGLIQLAAAAADYSSDSRCENGLGFLMPIIQDLSEKLRRRMDVGQDQ